MKVLFIASRLPYPPIGGDRLKNYWLLKILTKHFKVHLVSIAKEKISEEFYEWANEIELTYKIFKKPKYLFYLNALKFLTNPNPIQVNYYYFCDVQKYIDSIYKDYDLLFPVLIRTALYVINKQKPKILDLVDSIAINYSKSKGKVTSKFWKLIYSIESKRLFNFERKYIYQFDKTLFVNKDEANFYKSYFPDKVVWIPNGVNKSLFTYQKVNHKYQNCIAFFGKMNYQPNIDAVLWFVENVIDKLDKSLKFIIIGAYPTTKIKKLAKRYNNVEVTGFVEDPYEILKSCLCIVAPMQTGGGIQNKVLETMALETINIVSSLAAKPIGAKDKKDFIVLDNPNNIAKKINYIFKDAHKFESLKTNARNFIKNNFTWTIYEQKLLEIIKEIENAYSL